MKRKLIVWPIFLLFIGVLAIFAACGGGGSNDGGIKIPDSYTGSTEQAIITADNAVAIVQHLDTYGYNTEPVEVAQGIIDDADLFSNPRDIANLRIDSPCGGYYELEFNFTEGTGSFTGNVKFSNFCIDWWDENLYLTGTSSFEGSYMETEEVIDQIPALLKTFDIKLSLNGMSSKMGTLSIKYINGDEIYNETITDFGFFYGDSSEDNNFNYVLFDLKKNKTYWVENTELSTLHIFVQDSQLALSGRFYDYDYGFVDVENDGIMYLLQDDIKSGVLLISGNASKAKLTFNDDGSNLLEVDADNDGEFDDGSFVNVL